VTGVICFQDYPLSLYCYLFLRKKQHGYTSGDSHKTSELKICLTTAAHTTGNRRLVFCFVYTIPIVLNKTCTVKFSNFITIMQDGAKLTNIRGTMLNI